MSIQEPKDLQAFKSLLSAHPYVVVDFYADWCPPCKAIAPVFNALAGEHEGAGVAFAKVNVDNSPAIAQEYGVTAMPTFLFFERGEVFGDKAPVRGADPSALKEGVRALAEKAKGAGAGAGAAGGAKGAEGEQAEGQTVAGSYHFTQEQQHRSDWRTSLT